MGYLTANDPHNLTFVDVETNERFHGFNDLSLIATAPLVVPPPTQKRNTLEIPGKNGLIDLSTVLTGFPVYSNRSGSWQFIVDNSDPQVNPDETWVQRYNKVLNSLNGRNMKVYLDDDPEWYYEGNIQVSEWSPTHPWASVTIGFDFEPYRKSIFTSEMEFIGDGSSVNYYFRRGTGFNTNYEYPAQTAGQPRVYATLSNGTWLNLSASPESVDLLDYMPIIPDSTIASVSGSNSYNFIFDLRNRKLGYSRSEVTYSGSGNVQNPYGLQSFVMTTNAVNGLSGPGLAIRFKNGSSMAGKLKLEWRNGRL
jgi:hypothetical protein